MSFTNGRKSRANAGNIWGFVTSVSEEDCMGLRARRGLSIALLTLSALAGSAQAEPPAGEATVPAAPPPPPLAAAPPPAAAAPPPAIAAVSVWRDGAVKALP